MKDEDRRLVLQALIIIGFTVVLSTSIVSCGSNGKEARKLRWKDLDIQEKTLELKTRQWRQLCLEKKAIGYEIDEYCAPPVDETWKKGGKKKK